MKQSRIKFVTLEKMLILRYFVKFTYLKNQLFWHCLCWIMLNSCMLGNNLALLFLRLQRIL